MFIDITPDFAALADDWLIEARELASGVPYTAEQRRKHAGWGRLLTQHGWLTPEGTQATGQGTIATPAEVIAVIRGAAEL
jgi:hypothetical protein